jgi:hypothetical protein
MSRKPFAAISANARITAFFPVSDSRKRKLEDDAVEDVPVKKVQIKSAPIESSEKVVKINVGGASKLSWFNKLVTNSDLRPVLANLGQKIKDFSVQPESGCRFVAGFTEETRPVVDKKFKALLDESFPERYSPYVISLALAGVQIPDYDPPKLPLSLRKVLHKRVAAASDGNEKDATWVASHLCHQRRCINTDHLRWEPSWFNRLRDNCSGGDSCIHRPDRCLRPHRNALELIDWTTYIDKAVGGNETKFLEGYSGSVSPPQMQKNSP